MSDHQDLIARLRRHAEAWRPMWSDASELITDLEVSEEENEQHSGWRLAAYQAQTGMEAAQQKQRAEKAEALAAERGRALREIAEAATRIDQFYDQSSWGNGILEGDSQPIASTRLVDLRAALSTHQATIKGAAE